MSLIICSWFCKKEAGLEEYTLKLIISTCEEWNSRWRVRNFFLMNFNVGIFYKEHLLL